MRVNQLGLEMSFRQRIGHGLHDPVDKMRRYNPADDGTDHDGCERIDNTFAKLTEMLEEGHGPGGFVRWRRGLRIGFGFGHGFRLDAGCLVKLPGNWGPEPHLSGFRPILPRSAEQSRQPARLLDLRQDAVLPGARLKKFL